MGIMFLILNQLRQNFLSICTRSLVSQSTALAMAISTLFDNSYNLCKRYQARDLLRILSGKGVGDFMMPLGQLLSQRVLILQKR